MIVIIGIVLVLTAAIASASYFAFRSNPSSPGRPPALNKKPALTTDAPLTVASANPATAAESDTADANAPPVETATTSPRPIIRPADPPRADKGPFADTRRDPRTPFPGTAAATIYPYDSRKNSEPFQCLLDTRDLSCNGIGIGHTQQLYPTQMIVISALGKLLVGEIRWCHRIDNHYYIAGCRLVKAAT